eukprot:2948964-Prorocentrum_lima.AAC.1
MVLNWFRSKGSAALLQYLDMPREHPDHSDQPIGPEKVERPDAEPCWVPADALQAAFPTASRAR